MLVIKYIDNKVFNNIDTWSDTLEYIAWAIRASYQCTIMSTSGQAVFGRYIIFHLASVVDWLVITTAKQQQVDIDDVLGKSRMTTL